MIRHSRRASDAPRQKWVPKPKAMCGLGLRVMSNCWGFSNTSPSRLPEG